MCGVVDGGWQKLETGRDMIGAEAGLGVRCWSCCN